MQLQSTLCNLDSFGPVKGLVQISIFAVLTKFPSKVLIKFCLNLKISNYKNMKNMKKVSIELSNHFQIKDPLGLKILKSSFDHFKED